MNCTGFIYSLTFLTLIGCNKKTSQSITLNSKDTIITANSTSSDTIVVKDEGEFRDFLWSFQNDKDFQLQHIQFPLPIIKNAQQSVINENDWEYISEGFVGGLDGILYEDTVNLNSRETWTRLNDSSCAVFGYFSSKKIFQEFYFTKTTSGWSLNKYCFNKLNIQGKTESFFEFIDKFNAAKNNDFVESRISSNALYIDHYGLDADQPPIIEKLTKDKFNPDDGYVYQNLYFEKPFTETIADTSQIKLIHIQSDGTCYNINLVFEVQNDKWYMIKQEFP